VAPLTGKSELRQELIQSFVAAVEFGDWMLWM
jgi:hypothetical protein